MRLRQKEEYTMNEQLWYHQSHRTISELENQCMKGKCMICSKYR